MKIYKTTIILLLALVLGMFASSPLSARQFPAEFVDNYDADTVTLNVDLGFNLILKEERFRLFGINAPEVRGPEREAGLRSKAALRNLIADNTVFIVTIDKEKKGKYGRYLCYLYVVGEDGEAINTSDWLVQNGYAKAATY